MYRRGFAVIKGDLLSEKQIELLEKELVLRNAEYDNLVRFSKYGKPKNVSEYLDFYEIRNDKLYVPRNYFENGIFPFTDKTVDGEFADIKFLGKPRDYQNEFFSEIDWSINDQIWEVPCGHGKTTMSLFAASKYKRKTLVLVPTNYLVNQWINRIEFYCGESPLVLKSSQRSSLKNSLYNYNIFICTFDMYNSIINSNKDCNELLNELLNARLGFVILDEAHKCGAESYHPIIGEIPAKRRLALTATLRRGDGKDKILRYHFGKSYTLENQFPPAFYYGVNIPTKINQLLPKEKLQLDFINILDANDVNYKETDKYVNILYRDDKEEYYLRNSVDKKTKWLLNNYKAQVTQLDNYIVTEPTTVKTYQTIIRNCLNAGRTVLVLSKRKTILKTFHNLFKQEFKSSLVISETNKMKPAERSFMENEAQVIFGINQLAEYGLDIDRLDTLVMLHPISDPEQAIGRVIRFVPNKKQPLVFIPLPDSSAYLGIYRKSLKFARNNSVIKKPIKINELRYVLKQTA